MGKGSKYVQCRVCEKKVGRRGIAPHSNKHKREFLEEKGIDKTFSQTDYTYDDVVEFFNPKELNKSYYSRDPETAEVSNHKQLSSFSQKPKKQEQSFA